jgi:hypothetical protein
MLSGGCLCGAVRYDVDGPVFNETICHCRDCRKAVGAANVAWLTVNTTWYRIAQGRPASYRSSEKVVRQFCAACGTSLTYQYDDRMNEIDITIASLDEPDIVSPKDHTQASERLSWDTICDDRPEYPKFRTT